jgi:flagellar hook protein FlgE
MGLTSALNTSLNGLTLNETEINVLGNNISNAGTTGFKASDVSFQTQLAQSLSYGSAPSSTDGGTNPMQIGLGAEVSAITTDFSQGSITATSTPSDLAIQGDGFFVLNNGTSGGQVYTRNGQFTLDAGNELTNAAGQQVMGYGVDSNFNLITTGLTPLKISLGSMQLAEATSNVQVGGALSPQGTIASQGTVQTSAALFDNGASGGPALITSGSASTELLTNLATSSGGTPLFTLGQTITLAPTKGGQTMAAKTLTVGAGTSVSDLETFIGDTLGVQTTSGNGTPLPADPSGNPLGVSINGSGQLVVTGNEGAVNDFSLPVGSMTTGGASVPLPFTSSQTANGESATTTFTLYDSLGTPLNVRMTSYLESQGPNSTTYRYLLESPSQSGENIAIGNGTVTFDNTGKVSSAPTAQFSIDRGSTSATNPMLFTLDVSQISGISSTGSTLSLVNQNGTAPGTLTSYVIENSGIINGAFSNGITRNLGQIALAQFPNPQGLVQAGGNNFNQGVSSGLPQITAPGTFGAGTIQAGALEQSNTDIGKDLVNLIVASTNYQGNAKVISSIDQLVNVLLQLNQA